MNSLFAAVLRALKFDLYTTAARVVQFGKEPSHPDEVRLITRSGQKHEHAHSLTGVFLTWYCCAQVLLNGFDHQVTLVRAASRILLPDPDI